MAAGVEVCSVDGVRFVKSDDTRAAAQADGCGDVCCASPMALPAEAPAAAGTAWVAVSPAAAPLPAVPPLPWTAARPRGPPSFA